MAQRRHSRFLVSLANQRITARAISLLHLDLSLGQHHYFSDYLHGWLPRLEVLLSLCLAGLARYALLVGRHTCLVESICTETAIVANSSNFSVQQVLLAAA